MRDESYDYVRAPGQYDVDAASEASGLVCDDPSLAVQSEREDADINTIVRRFGLTGTIPEGLTPPTFGDFTGIDDFQTALNAVNQARDLFMQVPADIRGRFENDPQKFVEFCSDEKNIPEMRKMGLAIPEKMADPPMRVEVVNKDTPA